MICMVDIERGNAYLVPCAPPSSLRSVPISGLTQHQLVIFFNSQISVGSFMVKLGLCMICMVDIERAVSYTHLTLPTTPYV